MHVLKTHHLEWHVANFDTVRNVKRITESQVLECELKDELYSTRWKFRLIITNGGFENWNNRVQRIRWIGISLTLLDICSIPSTSGPGPITRNKPVFWTKARADVKMATETNGSDGRSIIITKGGKNDDEGYFLLFLNLS